MNADSSRVIRAPTEGNGNTTLRRGKALLVLPYFGSFGPWFPLYLHTLANQHTLDLLVVSDGKPPALRPNARHIEMTLDQVRELATARLGTPVRLHRSRNICDLRPAYGIIFETFIQGYEYWAFGDEDLIYGDLDRMLAPYLDGTADLVVPDTNIQRARGSIQGPLTVLRNHPRTNELAIRDPAYKEVLESREHWAYDETSWRLGGEISSFTKVVKKAEARGELSIRWGIPSATHLPARGRWCVYDGRTIHEDNGTELLYYHWGNMRHCKVQWPSPEVAASGFAFDRYGFYDSEIGRARLTVRRAEGRVRELASTARHRLSKWRAAAGATISGARSKQARS